MNIKSQNTIFYENYPKSLIMPPNPLSMIPVVLHHDSVSSVATTPLVFRDSHLVLS